MHKSKKLKPTKPEPMELLRGAEGLIAKAKVAAFKQQWEEAEDLCAAAVVDLKVARDAFALLTAPAGGTTA